MRVIMCVLMVLMCVRNGVSQDYGDALSKSILFFEGQRSGKLPSTQRLSWRKDSALNDGRDQGMDLTGGYYDAGDNVKFNFPMAYTTVLLSWSIIEYGNSMGPEVRNALDAVRWATDYFLKCTNKRNVVYVQVGDPIKDHNCWERPEDMDTLRTTYFVDRRGPGSEVSAEMAAAMAAGSLAFKMFGDKSYSDMLLKRAGFIFEFADRYRGSINASSAASGACPFYCDYNGYQDELLWGAAWLYKASGESKYWDYVKQNIITFKPQIEAALNEFGWDAKQAGLNVLVSQIVLAQHLESTTPFISYADTFICSVLPDSPTKTLKYTGGGLMYKSKGPDFQDVNANSFLLLTYARYLKKSQHVINCNGVVMTPDHLISFTKTQVDYLLGRNPIGLSYMVGYGNKFPQKIHHRASSSPSLAQHPQRISCQEGSQYFNSPGPNPNQLTGAVPGGPREDDSYTDERASTGKTEPTTYITAPLVGLFAYFKSPSQSV